MCRLSVFNVLKGLIRPDMEKYLYYRHSELSLWLMTSFRTATMTSLRTVTMTSYSELSLWRHSELSLWRHSELSLWRHSELSLWRHSELSLSYDVIQNCHYDVIQNWHYDVIQNCHYEIYSGGLCKNAIANILLHNETSVTSVRCDMRSEPAFWDLKRWWH